MLTAQLAKGNLSHAYLFLGKEGTGKEYLAKEFARYILCPKNTEDECPSCVKYEHGGHPDFIYIDGEEGIKIEQIRQAIERISLSPGLSERKVFLISSAENITSEAANALLKTLEEPPLDSVIILTSSSEKRLPETIISRAQVLKLNMAKGSEIAKVLAKDFDQAEIDRVIRFAEGSIGEAKRLMLDEEAFKEKQKMYDDIQKLVDSEQLVERFKIIEAYDSLKRLDEFYELFARVIFETLLSRAGATTEKVLLEEVPLERLVAISKKILKINHDLQYNVSLRVAMEEIALKDILSV